MTDILVTNTRPAVPAVGESALPSVPEPPTTAQPEGNPGLIGLPLIIAGAAGLGFTNTGIVTAGAAAVPILLSATAIGLLITTIWSAALAQNVNATIYGTFFGFYGSFAALSLGLTHDWFGIPDSAVQQTTALWLGSWLLTIGILTVLVLRLPWTYPVLLLIVDIALLLLLIGSQSGSAVATQAGGWFVFGFVGFVIYFYVASLWPETGGKSLPLGRPLNT